MYEILTVGGSDAESFLQAQLTQDLRLCSATEALPAAWCNAKGRVIATMRVVRRSDDFMLVIGGGMGKWVCERLSIYKFRAKVEIEIAADWTSRCCPDDDFLNSISLLPPAATRHAARQGPDWISIRIAGDLPEIELFDAVSRHVPDDGFLADGIWKSQLLRSGHVIVDRSTTEKFTPHMLSLDLAGAVSFTKGCYPGQEIVARTEHLGKSNRRLARYETETETAATGDDVCVDGEVVGNVVAACSTDVLAVVSIDHLSLPAVIAGNAAHPFALRWSNAGKD